MFKRANVKKLNNRTGLSQDSESEEDSPNFFKKSTSIDNDFLYHSESKQSMAKSPHPTIEEEPPKISKKSNDASFVSYKSDASKKDKPKEASKQATPAVNKTPAQNTPVPNKTPVQATPITNKTPLIMVNNTPDQTKINKTPKEKTPEPTINKTPITNKTPIVDRNTPAKEKSQAKPEKTPERESPKQESTKKFIISGKKDVIQTTETLRKTETLKKTAPPLPVKKTVNDQKGVTAIILKKMPITVKKEISNKINALQLDKWMPLNSKIKCQEPHNPWECDKDHFNEIMANLKKNKIQYTDDIFLPSLSSLANNPKQVKLLYQDFNKWMRVTDVYKGQKLSIYHSIDPNDIKQGELGNCYFLSALSSLAEKPDRILRLFEDQTINEHNCYYVRVCVDGIWRYIVIDDYTPCSMNCKPVFAQPRSEEGFVEFWVLLLEKAWAKIFGSYENIDAGFPEDVFFAFTGAPCERIETEDDDAWSRLEAADKNSFIMTAACGQDDMKVENFDRLGLVPDHAYSLIGVHTVTHPREGKVYLCEIRNPWGWASEEWNGKWSDSYKGWSDIPQVKKSLNLGQDDGRFMMCFDDFKAYFDYVTVCKMRDNYYYVSYPIRTNHASYSIRTFKIEESGSFSLTITQKDERYFRNSKSINYEYTVTRLVLGRKLEDGEFEFIDGVSDESKNLTLNAEDMEAGEYYVIVAVDTADDKKLADYVLSYYGSQDITFDRIRYKDGSDVLERILRTGGKGKILATEKKGTLEYTCYLCLDEGFIVENYKNKGGKEIWINKDYSKIDKEKYQILREDGVMKFKARIEANGEFTVCGKILDIFEEFNPSVKNELK